MSSEEDFSLVEESLAEDSLQGCGTVGDCPVQQVWLQLPAGLENLEEIKNPGVSSTRPPSREEELQKEKDRLHRLRLEEEELLRKIQEVRAALSEEDALQERLKQLAQTMSRLPERGVYLGELVSRSGDTPAFDMKSRIVYPMEGGTALMTFENEAVAQHILRMKQHTVHLDKGYRIRVEAQPVQLVVPKQVEVDSVVSPHSVLVSDLPQLDPESLLDKLGFHFSKKVNGGGEVHSCQMMEDTWAAVVTFTEDDVVGPLVLKQLHPVRVQNSTHQVRVSPFICGQMGGLQVQTQVCSRTVLLTGIPDVLDLESLQDYLTVHFQKESNGGGEVLQCAYNPPGGRTLAVFSDQSRV